MTTVRATIPIVRAQGANPQDLTVESTTPMACDDCCGTGSGSNIIDCGCAFEWYPAGFDPAFVQYPINLPTYMAARYYFDIAGFTNSSGCPTCASFNGTSIKTCPGGQFLGFSYWYNQTPPFNIVLALVGEGRFDDDPEPHWAASIQIPCGTGSISYNYRVSVADYNGCGSAVMVLTDIVPTDPSIIPCTTYPASIVINTAPGDLCNCLCGCFIAYPNWHTKLYLRLYNIATTPPLPPGTVFNAELDWPASTNFLTSRGVFGIQWFGSGSLPGGGAYLVGIACACAVIGSECGFVVAGSFFLPGFFSFITPGGGTPFNTFGVDCGRTGVCYYTGSINGDFGGTADIIVSCDPIP